MQENLQPNKELNLALERAEAVKSYNTLNPEWNSMPEKEKGYYDNDKRGYVEPTERAQQIQKEQKGYKTNVENIDKYKELAKPGPESVEEKFNTGTGDPEALKQEKEKVEQEIASIAKAIESTSLKLNELREKLGMPPSEDIPSLMVKKEKLESLRKIQKDLESKLDFVNKKTEAVEQENVENSNIEKSGNQELMSGIEGDLKKISALLDSRVTRKETGVSALAMRAYERSDLEGIKHYISLVNHKVNEMQDGWSTDDKPETMQNLSRALSELNENIKSIVSKIKDEEKRKKFSQAVSVVTSNIESTQHFFTRRAEALKQYQNLR
jgi:chromosome segregation ATPase